MKSEAKTVAAYLASLPPDRRAAIAAVRQTILDHLPDGYVEAMDWGMISYQVPLDRYPGTYNHKPLMYAALASQKAYMAVYLSAIYADASARAAFEQAYRATGKRYDVGQSCVRFRKLEDLPLDVIGAAVAGTPVDDYIERYERSRRRTPRVARAREKKGRGTAK
jgi:hypothetical protein